MMTTLGVRRAGDVRRGPGRIPEPDRETVPPSRSSSPPPPRSPSTSSTCVGRRVATVAQSTRAAGPVRLAVPTAGLSTGVYVVRVQTADGVALDAPDGRPLTDGSDNVPAARFERGDSLPEPRGLLYGPYASHIPRLPAGALDRRVPRLGRLADGTDPSPTRWPTPSWQPLPTRRRRWRRPTLPPRLTTPSAGPMPSNPSMASAWRTAPCRTPWSPGRAAAPCSTRAGSGTASAPPRPPTRPTSCRSARCR